MPGFDRAVPADGVGAVPIGKIEYAMGEECEFLSFFFVRARESVRVFFGIVLRIGSRQGAKAQRDLV